MKDYNPPTQKSFWQSISAWTGTIVLTPIVIYYTLNAGSFTFIDYINLLIHEGGHGIFKIFGKFLYTIGGTLMQIIIPSMFIIFYFIKKKRFGTQVFLVLLGENLINISVYAADARAQKLPLLGGNKVYHDWNWLLRETGLLEYDSYVGHFFFGLGVLMFVYALLIPLQMREKKHVTIPLGI
ncbi:MAG: hypothetical protein NTX65_09685 [Ignavibacteriales bacterium]|nr:hypothetical protein [Ignavibacteriales bacterium]